ncbi:MAG: SPW repeat domain-containing protein [Gaiellaceae bacterium]
MLRQGPIPAFVHGAIEYLAAIVFIAAPFLFGFDSDAATAISIVVGIVVLIVTASTDIPTGLAKTIPVTIHAVLDLVVAGFLIAAPFLFGFTDESAPTAFFIVLGVVHLLLTIGTRFLPARAAA